VAVATLWDMLNDFLSLPLYSPEWLIRVGRDGRVGQKHPFICASAVSKVVSVCACACPEQVGLQQVASVSGR
jgi:hypothetical protein